MFCDLQFWFINLTKSSYFNIYNHVRSLYKHLELNSRETSNTFQEIIEIRRTHIKLSFYIKTLSDI